MKWISIEDQLPVEQPDFSEIFIVYESAGNFHRVTHAYYDFGNECFRSDDEFDAPMLYVTHWMHFPDPPKEE